MSFTSDITVFLEKTKLSRDLVVRKLAFDGFKAILLRSPVDTGRFRASWRIGLDETDLSVEAPRASVKYKTSASEGVENEKKYGLTYDVVTEQDAETTAQKATFGQTVIISNNLPYALPLENGHSQQAPAGVLAVAFLELTTNFAQTVKSVT